MLRRKTSSSERQSAPADPEDAVQAHAPEEAARAHSPASEPYLEAVAAILKALASDADDANTTRKRDEWIQHVLVLAPSPDSPSRVARERDWQGVRRYAVSVLQRWQEKTGSRIAAMQDVLTEMIEAVSRAVTVEAEADEQLLSCLSRLRSAVASSSDDFRAEAFGAIDEMKTHIEGRQRRQSEVTGLLSNRIAQLSVELAEARISAERDGLTELANRAVFDRELERTAHLSALTHEPGTFILIDVDEFKEINDRLGHTVGDEALRMIARKLVLSFPRRTDLVARYGGDEFAVLLSGTTAKEAAAVIEGFLAMTRATEIETRDGPLRVTTSVGIAEIVPGTPAREIITQADGALYAAKAAGRDRASVWPRVTRAA